MHRVSVNDIPNVSDHVCRCLNPFRQIAFPALLLQAALATKILSKTSQPRWVRTSCAFRLFRHPDQPAAKLPGTPAEVRDGAVHAPPLAGLDPALHVFRPSRDQRVDQARNLARGRGDRRRASFRARRPRCLAPMNVWLLRTDAAGTRRAGATLSTTLGERPGRDVAQLIRVPGVSRLREFYGTVHSLSGRTGTALE